MLLLGIEASRRWNASPMQLGIQHETRIFEFLLPIVACGFAFGSIPEQMKNFFATGLFFLAIGVVRLQQDFFRSFANWPIALLSVGIALMLSASKHPTLRVALDRLLQRRV